MFEHRGLPTIPQNIDADAQLLAERQDANIATAVRLISNTISGLVPLVHYKDYSDGKLKYVPEDDHPVSELLSHPNPEHTSAELLTHVSQSLLLNGNAFVGIEQSMTELWPLETKKVEVQRSDNGRIVAYKYSPRLQEIPYKPEEIIHLRLYNANDPFYGRSGVEPLRNQILTDHYADKYNCNFFKNNATPGTVFMPEGNDLTEEQVEIYRKSFEKNFKGVDNAHKHFVSPIAGTFTQIETSLKDMAFAENMRMNREKIYAVLGIPPSVGGVYEFANYANALIQEKSFWQHTIIPLLKTIEDALTLKLLIAYGQEYCLRFDLSQVQTLQQDAEIKARTATLLVSGGIITPNEARQEYYQLEPIEGGDELRSNVALPEYDDDESEDAPNKKPGDKEDEGDGKGVLRTSRRHNCAQTSPTKLKKSDPRYLLWKSHDHRLRKAEIRMQPILTRFLNGQKRRVIENLQTATGKGSAMSVLYKYTFMKDDMPSDPDKIFDMMLEDRLISEATDTYVRETVRDNGQRGIDELNLDLNFNVRNPNVQVALDQYRNRIKRINRTTSGAIRDLLAEGYEQGYSIQELEKRIRELTAFSRERATMIARTETNAYVSGGAHLGYEQVAEQGLDVRVEWIATQDSVTRDAHADADSQTVGINDSFLVGGEYLKYPGDPSGSPENVINCRCAHAAVVT